jgi:hypothetical protein
MGTYWVLECFRESEKDGRSFEFWPNVPSVESWLTGERFKGPISQPIILYWDTEKEYGKPKALYKAGIPLMSRRLYKAICKAGVDNLDIYETEIRSHNSKEINRDYLAFNIIGVIKAVNMAKSKYNTLGGPPLISVFFNSIVIDEKAIGSVLLFRIAECVSAIVIHDSVKKQLERQNFGLTFIKPEDWMG